MSRPVTEKEIRQIEEIVTIVVMAGPWIKRCFESDQLNKAEFQQLVDQGVQGFLDIKKKVEDAERANYSENFR